MNKPTVIIGASDNPERYSYKATVALKKHGHTVYPIGIRPGNIENTEVITTRPDLKNIDTVTLYVGAANQPQWYDFILSLNPSRILFNPGTENPEFEKIATEKGILCLEACTLVLLSLKNY